MDRIDDIAGGVVRHAGAAAMRRAVDWDLVRPGLLVLADHPGGAVALRAAIRRINDPEVRAVLAAWFRRLAEDHAKEARRVGRPAETGLGPLQTTLMGLSGAAVIAGLVGTLAAPVAGLVAAAFGAGAGAAWYGRMRVLRRADEFADRADALRRLATLCEDG